MVPGGTEGRKKLFGQLIAKDRLGDNVARRP